MTPRKATLGAMAVLFIAILSLLLALSRRPPIQESVRPEPAPRARTAPATEAEPAPAPESAPAPPSAPPAAVEPPALEEPAPVPASVRVVDDLPFDVLLRLGEMERPVAASGETAFDGLAAGPIVLAVFAPPRLLLGRRELTLAAGESRTVRLSELTPGVEATGRTVDRDGRPVPDALVRACVEDADDERLLGEAQVRSDAEGRFRILLAAGLAYRFYGEKEGYGPFDPPVARADPGAPPDVEVVLSGEVVLAGRVVDASGLPVSGATVRALRRLEHPGSFQDRHHVRRTDEDGRFDFDDLPEGWLVEVRVAAEGFAPPGVPHVRMARGMAVVEIVVHQERPLEIRLVDAESEAPVTGAQFTATRDRPGAPSRGARVDPLGRGRYLLRGYAAVDRLRLGVHAPGHLGRRVAVDVGAPGPVVIRLRSTGDVKMSGRVVDLRGRPVARATLSVTRVVDPVDPGEDPVHSMFRTTDAQGRFRLSHLKEGAEHRIAATRTRGMRVELATPHVIFVAEPDGEILLVALPVGGVLARIVGAESGEPVAGVFLRLDRRDEDGGWPLTQLARGGKAPGPHRWGGIPVGVYDAKVYASGRVSVKIPGVTVRAGETTDLGEIRLAPKTR